jgi:hypothetical protein
MALCRGVAILHVYVVYIVCMLAWKCVPAVQVFSVFESWKCIGCVLSLKVYSPALCPNLLLTSLCLKLGSAQPVS